MSKLCVICFIKYKFLLFYRPKERLSPLVYSGYVPKGPSNPVVLKHSNRNGTKAHKFTAQIGIAPNLIMSKKCHKGQRIIIMKKVEGQHPLQEAATMTYQQREILLDATVLLSINFHSRKVR